MLFSEREGYIRQSKSLQLDEVNQELDTCIWNVVSTIILKDFRGLNIYLWSKFFILPLVQLPEYYDTDGFKYEYDSLMWER